jgi:hypothetical protein
MQRTTAVLFIIAIALSFSPTIRADNTSPKFGMQPSYGHQDQNLFDEVLARKNQLAWDRRNGDTLPADLCETLLANCVNKKLPFKILAYPLEVPGQEEQGALVLSWTADQDHPDIVILASVTEDSATFFLLSHEGTLLKTAYRNKNGTWASLSNSVARDHFERERNQWHKWLVSLDGSHIGPKP